MIMQASHAFSLFSLFIELGGCVSGPTEEARQAEGMQRIHAILELIPPPPEPSAVAAITSADEPHLCRVQQVKVEGSGIRVQFEPMGLYTSGKSFRAELGQTLTPSDLGLAGCSLRADQLDGKPGVMVEAQAGANHRAKWILADQHQ